MATSKLPQPSCFLQAMACSSRTHLQHKLSDAKHCRTWTGDATAHHDRRSAVGLSQASTTSSRLPMRAMLSLNVFIQNDDGLLGPAVACCEVTRTSNQSTALQVSGRPSKNNRIASSVSTNALLHVWLTNHEAGATCCAVSTRAISRSLKLQRFSHVKGLTYI